GKEEFLGAILDSTRDPSLRPPSRISIMAMCLSRKAAPFESPSSEIIGYADSLRHSDLTQRFWPRASCAIIASPCERTRPVVLACSSDCGHCGQDFDRPRQNA